MALRLSVYVLSVTGVSWRERTKDSKTSQTLGRRREESLTVVPLSTLVICVSDIHSSRLRAFPCSHVHPIVTSFPSCICDKSDLAKKVMREAERMTADWTAATARRHLWRDKRINILFSDGLSVLFFL
ncbi:hypothetical protein HNY73_008213 [Argiope bruennichi]|uniref:Uncharacterized protein n=1 Tax=Argiope bruennichi TaxID=94029 RepID=A0A8T0F7Z9_ARGBR|nr:hypothetical protein HNY73_008213 [Argiope bruennichi]